jgi:fructokinase
MDLREVCFALIEKYGLKMLILTCGTNGSYVFTSDAMTFLKTPVVAVEDTVGAGDAFSAAFCAGILCGMEPFEAHKLAVKTSAYVCTCKGAMPELPDEIRKATHP